jgi:hypothetical protein
VEEVVLKTQKGPTKMGKRIVRQKGPSAVEGRRKRKRDYEHKTN